MHLGFLVKTVKWFSLDDESNKVLVNSTILGAIYERAENNLRRTLCNLYPF